MDKRNGLMILIILCSAIFLASCTNGLQLQVFFESNGGSEVSPIATDGSSLVNIPSNPTKEGYTFEGWFWDNGIFENPLTVDSLSEIPISNDMTVYAKWGINTYSIEYNIQFNNALYNDDFPLESTDKVIQIVSSLYNSALLTAQGKVYVWGYNNDGQLGNGTTETIYFPIQITSTFSLSESDKIVQIELGFTHGAALSESGQLFLWGANWDSRLGDGTTIERNRAVNITGNFELGVDEVISKIILGSFHSAAITSEGRLFMWGNNQLGSVGVGDDKLFVEIPIDISSLLGLAQDEKILQVSLGDRHSSVLTTNGRLIVWGENRSGQLANGNTTTSFVPIDVTNSFGFTDDEKIIQISNSNSSHSGVLTSAGRVLTWGYNYSGQLGNGTFSEFEDPNALPNDITSNFNLTANESIIYINMNASNSSAYTSSGRVFTWGWDGYNQLGRATNTIGARGSSIPVDITDIFHFVNGEAITQIIVDSHTLVLTSLGGVYSWGYNNNGQLGNGTTSIVLSPIPIVQIENYILSVDEYIYDAILDIVIPTKRYFTFDGWYIDSELTVEFDSLTMPAYNMILYGQWIPK
jgi:uncharacterized repeat protein (TIGR02543 family)